MPKADEAAIDIEPLALAEVTVWDLCLLAHLRQVGYGELTVQVRNGLPTTSRRALATARYDLRPLGKIGEN